MLRYSRPRSQLNLVFASSGGAHLGVFLCEERPRDSSGRWKTTDVSPSPMPPKVHVPSPSADLFTFYHQKTRSYNFAFFHSSLTHTHNVCPEG